MRWWDLGARTRQPFPNFKTSSFKCPFCGVEGGWSHVFRGETDKRVSEVYKCTTCGNHTFVLSGASKVVADTGIDFLAAPSPKPQIHEISAPEGWPEPVGRSYAQARRAVMTHSWEAAVVMARTAIQAAIRAMDAKGKTIYDEIENLRSRGILPQALVEWAHELRILGAAGTHLKEDDTPITEEDARQAEDLAFYFGHYLFTVPAEVAKLRARRGTGKKG